MTRIYMNIYIMLLPSDWIIACHTPHFPGLPSCGLADTPDIRYIPCFSIHSSPDRCFSQCGRLHYLATWNCVFWVHVFVLFLVHGSCLYMLTEALHGACISAHLPVCHSSPATLTLLPPSLLCLHFHFLSAQWADTEKKLHSHHHNPGSIPTQASSHLHFHQIKSSLLFPFWKLNNIFSSVHSTPEPVLYLGPHHNRAIWPSWTHQTWTPLTELSPVRRCYLDNTTNSSE